jgi:hypothetical protein
MKKLLFIACLLLTFSMQSCLVGYHGHRWHHHHDVIIEEHR